jgi:hypothetical protein
MKKITILLAVLALALMAAPALASTYYLTIYDPPAGSPDGTIQVDTQNWFTTSTYPDNESVINGWLRQISFIVVKNQQAAVILDEPAEFGGGASDFLNVWSTNLTDYIYFTFESDGAANFAADLAALPPGTPHVTETGALQDLSSYFTSITANGTVVIQVESDINDVVPLPPSALLLGSGLLGLGLLGFRRRRQKA